MSLSITEILSLIPPFELAEEPTFAIFYVEAERLVTLAQNRDSIIVDLYDKIITTIGSSSMLDSKGVKTWVTEAYQTGKSNTLLDSENYYYRDVSFVGDLQQLVLDRYDSLDDFYEEEEITVSQTFAFLSEAAGYAVSPQYIEDIS